MVTRTLIIALVLSSCAFARTYSTSFSATENPISESGNWLNGATDGLDWGDVKTSSSQAHGTVISGAPPFNDATGALSGTWGPNQTASATVKINGTNATTQEEVELRVNTVITAHSITGYECDYNVKNGQNYVIIVRWNGALNDFTYCNNGGTCSGGPNPVLFSPVDGDTISCSNVGGTITLFVNGVAKFITTDATYSGGGPGIGFWQTGGTTGNLTDIGLTSFSATDGVAASTCGPTQGAKLSNGALIKCF